MSDEERLNLSRALGHLEGRMTAMEAREAARDDVIAKMDAKLDTIMAKLNQSMGGLAAGKLFAAIAAAAASAAFAVWSHLTK